MRRRGQHAPVADQYHPLEPEALPELVDLTGHRVRVRCRAFEYLDRHRTARGRAQQAEDDLQVPFLPSRLCPRWANGQWVPSR